MKIDAHSAGSLEPWFPGFDFASITLIDRGPVCWFVRAVLKQGAMTIAPFVFYGRERFDPDSVRSLALLAHELHHVQQYARYGHAGFLMRYLRDLVAARFHYSDGLPFEAECYALQAKVYDGLSRQMHA